MNILKLSQPRSDCNSIKCWMHLKNGQPEVFQYFTIIIKKISNGKFWSKLLNSESRDPPKKAKKVFFHKLLSVMPTKKELYCIQH